jgi:ketosteroid isomerase-like protein
MPSTDDTGRPEGDVTQDIGCHDKAPPGLEWLGRIYDDYALGRTERLFEHLDQDVLWAASGRAPVLQSFVGSYRGPAGVLQFLERLAKDWTIIRYAVEGMRAEDDQIHVRNRVLAVNLNTGKHAEAITHHRLVVRGQTIVQFEESYEDEGPLAAAGHLDACSPVGRERRD